MKRERYDGSTLSEAEEEDLILVKGTRTRLFRDDYLAEEVEKGRFHVGSEEEPLWMDRWDVRNLLGANQTQERAEHGEREQSSTSQVVDFDTDLTERERKLVEKERYGDLLLDDTSEGDQGETQTEGRSSMDKDSHPFSAWVNLLPDGLRSLVPSDSKGQKILLQAARFIRKEERGSQIEVVLRVKQANNPNFNFLFPEDRVHPLLRWLTDSPDAAPMFEEIKSKDANSSKVVVNVVTKNKNSQSGGTSKTSGNAVIPLVSAEYDDSDEPDMDVEQTAGVDKQIIQKTAEYVSKKGKEFEAIIKAKERNNPNFGFLFPWHPQNVHYLECLRKCKSPKVESNSNSLKVMEEGKVFSHNEECHDGTSSQDKDAELKSQRLQRVREFFREKQGQKIKDIQVKQHSAIEKVEAERKKRLKSIANLHNIFS